MRGLGGENGQNRFRGQIRFHPPLVPRGGGPTSIPGQAVLD
jgi:hypothetical protein